MSRPHRMTAASAVGALALMAAIAGCGGGSSHQDPPTATSIPTSNVAGPTTSSAAPTTTAAPVTDPVAQRLFARSKAATAALKSLRITGTETSNGTTAKLDLRFGEHNTAGHITQGGYLFDLIFIGKKFYFRAPVAFLKAQFKNKIPPAVVKSEGKYVVTDSGSASATPFAAFANRNALLAGVYTAHPNLRHGPNRKINGVLCASLIDPGRGTFYVRADNALPVRIDATGTGGGSLAFSRLNQVPDPGPPPAGQAVDSKGNPV